MKKPRICIALVGKLPVPATLGGAVEFLAETLIKENEKKGIFEITVLSVDEPKARKKAKEYSHTRFVWFKPYKLWNKFWWRIYALNKKYFDKELCFPYQRKCAARWLKQNENEFDWFLAESELEMFVEAGIKPEKVLYHLHWAGAPTPRRDDAFGYMLPASIDIAKGWCEKTGRCMDTVLPLLNCTDLPLFQKHLTAAERKSFRQSLGLQEDIFTILYAGRLVPIKGPRELLKAFRQIRQEKIALIIVGSTNFGLQEQSAYIKEMKELANACNNPVIFTGYVPHEELWKYFSISDVLVSPSQCREAAGLINIEAMASALPVICTKVGGVPEYVSDKCGLFVEWDNDLVESLKKAILKLYNSPNILAEMSENGPKQAAQFGKEAYYERFCSVMKHLEEKQGY